MALWQSVFQPGTTPQLIIATHLSFTALVTTLAWLIYATSGNIHFIVLLCISLCLWAAVTWFIQELKYAQLNDNKALGEEAEDKDDTKSQTASVSGTDAASFKPSKNLSQLRSRKL